MIIDIVINLHQVFMIIVGIHKCYGHCYQHLSTHKCRDGLIRNVMKQHYCRGYNHQHYVIMMGSKNDNVKFLSFEPH